MASTLANKTISESLALETTGKVDRERKIIPGVKLLGAESRTDTGKVIRRYTKKALESAARLYQGLPIYANHPDDGNPLKQRRIEEQIGKVVEPLEARPDGVYGSIQYRESSPHTAMLLEAVESDPAAMSCSHNANIAYRMEGSTEIAEDIVSGRSVDIVTRGGTTKSLFESQSQGSGKVKTTVKQILDANVIARPVDAKPLLEILEEDPILAEVPVETEAVDSGTAIKDAFKAAIMAVIDDDSLDMEATKKKIVELLKASEKAAETGDAPTDATDDGDDAEEKDDITESQVITKLQSQVKTLSRNMDVARVLAESGLNFNDVSVEHMTVLESQETTAAMRKVVSEWAPVDRVPKAGPSYLPLSQRLAQSTKGDTYDSLSKQLLGSKT